MTRLRPLPGTTWVGICPLERLEPERGVAALVAGVQVAVFRLRDGTLHAIDHRDPCSGANVLARGIVGTRGEVPVLISPMFRQAFDLHTGACLDDPARAVRVHAVRARGGWVEVSAAAGPAPLPEVAGAGHVPGPGADA
ncbi:MAG TPA: nitrite reductase small subunit NirD [Kineosporiaceae bacterium]|nr:nitrite reductase small subunit NirD [Kineosporiaceae bacterium]